MQKKAEDGYFEEITGSYPKRNPGEILGLFSLPVLVLGLLFSCSWVALAFGQAIPEEDTRSKITVDYSAWEEFEIQPVSLGIIQEVETDRKDGVDLGKIQAPAEEGWFWWTPEVTLAPPSEGQEDSATEAISTLPIDPLISPTDTSAVEAIGTATVTITGTPQTATPTPLNSETPTPSATNTPVHTATSTPTATITPTRTNTLTSTPTFTSTFTPSPTRTPDNICPPGTLSKFKGTGRFIQLNLNNFSSAPVTLESVSLTWPVLNGNLIRITLGGETIWSGSDSPPVIALDPGDWLPADRTVGPLSFERLEFLFEDIAVSTGYTLTIVLSVPCSLTTNY